jgi:2-hydroxychromene-2-carboxylate isomerase
MTGDHAHTFDAALTVCIDFKSPQCFLAKDPTYSLADEVGLEIDWLPLITAQMTLPPKPTDGDRGARHRRARAEYAKRDIERYAEQRGLVIRDVYRPPVDSSWAAIGLLWVKSEAPDRTRAYLDETFARYWRGELDVEDASAIVGVAGSSGIETDGLIDYLHGAGASALEELQVRLREAGLTNVPGYLVKGEVFIGRQHLPMIRWLLMDKRGPAPI